MSDCIEWDKSINNSGYGKQWHNGRNDYAHRVAWMKANDSEIPAGSVVMHKCDNRLCVNPEHLVLGSQRQNVKDCWIKGRHKPHNKVLEGDVEHYVLESEKTAALLSKELGISDVAIQTCRRRHGQTRPVGRPKGRAA